MIQRRHLIPALESLDSAVVACAGDIMLDRFVYGAVNRISPEAPIPVLRVEKEQSMLGGVGNVVRNLGALGCGIRLFSVTGEDPAGREVSSLLQQVPNCRASMLAEAARRTPVKVRYVAHGQQLLRADQESSETVGPQVLEPLLAQFSAQLAACSIVFLSDYAKGLLTGSNAQRFIQAARAAGKQVVVDPKARDFQRYRFASLIKPNLKELVEATGLPAGENDTQEFAARKLLDQTEAQFILVTRGPAGMMLVPRGEPRVEFRSSAREVYDVSGAGDTVAAVLVAALGSGAGIREAVELANIAAGIVVGKTGTAVAYRSEVIDEIEHESAAAAADKILRPSRALSQVDVWRRMGRRVGFAHGRFHPLSPLHLDLLEQARSRCDRVVVGLTDGGKSGAPSSPAQLSEHALILASLANVDAVVVCDTHSPAEMIEMLRPRLVARLACDGDSELERRLLEPWRGELVLVGAGSPAPAYSPMLSQGHRVP